MTQSATPHWPRPHWSQSDQNAQLLYLAFGHFESQSTHSLPNFAHVRLFNQDNLQNWPGHPLKGELGNALRASNPTLFARAEEAPHMLRLEVELKDQSDLDYLRSTLHALVRLFAQGACAIIDPITGGFYDEPGFTRDVASGNTRTLRQHYLVVREAMSDAAAQVTVSTRGLRKFARPDLAITHVPEAQADMAGQLCQQLADALALGTQIKDGQSFSVTGVGALVARPHEPVDHPFHNRYIELGWPLHGHD